jgi:hypothetical protein
MSVIVDVGAGGGGEEATTGKGGGVGVGAAVERFTCFGGLPYENLNSC